MSEHYGAWSLVPPVLAIGLAMATRRVVLSLFIGIVAGALILSHGNPVQAVVSTCEEFLWPALTSQDHLRVFAFTLLMGALVGVIHRNGGMLSLVHAIRPWATSRRRGQLTGWLLGLIIFFDDYANTLLLGTTFRPVADRLRISREKLAYIVDSTAAPIAGLALVSTWVASEVGYIQQGFENLGLAVGSDAAFHVFVATIPYRFYPLLALLLVGVIAVTRRDFGPMLTAERRAIAGVPNDAGELSDQKTPDAAPSHWLLAVVPVLVVVVTLVFLLYKTGRQEKPTSASLWQIVGSGDSYLALVYASLAGLLVAWLLSRYASALKAREIGQAAMFGARLMLPALVILWLAWTLADVVSMPTPERGDRLGTAAYLSGIVRGRLAPEWLPTVVFLLASVVAFCTGTSWGTMGMLTPLVIETTWKMLADSGQTMTLDQPVLLGAIGGVLAGAIFGDHCSPISDTTILSSRASGCDHFAHVWTQLPYAIFVAFISVMLGTIPIGFGWPARWTLPLAAGVMFVSVLVIGRNAEDSGGGRVES